MKSSEFKDLGLDESGFVTTIGQSCSTQSAFEPLVESAKRLILTAYKDDLHSVYLYGSVARGVNGDVLQVARDYVQRISMADNELKKTLFREVSKKVVRALASSVAHKEPCWIADFVLCKDLSIAHYPEMAQQIDELFRASQCGGVPSAPHLDLVLTLATQASEYLET